ncbi:MAG: chromosomal replication initiator protein DnaA, partial [Pseudomonadota bacterium]
MTHEVWGTVRQNLRSSVGAHAFTSWIEPLEFDDAHDGVAKFFAPTAYAGTYVGQHFSHDILAGLRSEGLKVERVSFEVLPELAKKLSESEEDEDDAESEVQRGSLLEVTCAKLDPKYTFERFVVGKPNELAFAAAKRVAEGGSIRFNPLVLYGGVGLGKTHLMQAIAWELHERRPELTVLYISAEQFMYRFVQALRERKMMDFKNIFRNADVLMVDDMQFIAGKDSTQEEFFHTFNALVDQGKQIIISADRAPGEIENLEERIASRLQSGLAVDLHPTDFELRLGILHSKVEFYRQSYPGLVIEDGVINFLAHRISTNVRVLEGALTRLFAFGSLVGRAITMDLVKECLADVLRASDRKTTVEEIQRKVSEHYNIRLSDMLGPKRSRNLARPRQIAMYLSKKLTTRSLPDIGRRFGGRDHTTVMHGVKKIETLIVQDSQMADDLEILRRALEA